jgi:enoyl-CoA hydratase/carnithine racemase
MRYIVIDRRGPFMWVTFNRPDKLNVLHAEDLPGLRDIIVNVDPGVAGLVFTGAGSAAFSAGMNIETFVGMDSERRHSSANSPGSCRPSGVHRSSPSPRSADTAWAEHSNWPWRVTFAW